MDIVTDLKQLRKPCRSVDDDDLPGIATTLITEMREHKGQGLAANQVGIDIRAFVMLQKKYAPIFIANPEIVRSKGSVTAKETCMSLPCQEIYVKRPKSITITGINQYRKPLKYKLSGIEARRACHEVDHLDGKLIIDYE